MMHKAWSSIEEVPYCFPRSSVKFHIHTTKEIVDFDPYIGRFRTVTPVRIDRCYEMMHKAWYCRHGSGGWAGGCQNCGIHISVTTWRIVSIRSPVELSRPVVIHCHGHFLIYPIWACPWVKKLSNLPQIGSRLCGRRISETAGWIYPI